MPGWGGNTSWDEKKEEKGTDWSASGGGWDDKSKAKTDDAWATAKKEDAWTTGADPWAAAAGHEAPQQEDKQEQGNSWDKKEEQGNSWDKKEENSWDKKEENSWDKKEGGSSWDQPAQDSWGSAAPAADRPQPANEFWDTQKWNKEAGTLSRKEEWELAQGDTSLFEEGGHAVAGLNFSKYENVPVNLSGNKADQIPVCKTFDEIYQKFGQYLPKELIQNLQRVGYTVPTPVQKFAIPCGLVGRDIMCCAQTGSGKTAAFLIPVIGQMMKNHASPVGSLEVPFEGECRPDCLILTPTRELCIQIHQEAVKFCHRTPYRVDQLYGGAKTKMQLAEIAKGADLMVATPGRLQDFINRGVVKVDQVNILVLDEADRMLDMGFESQVREIVETSGMPSKEGRQTMMFSATFAENCQQMAMQFLFDHIFISVGVIGSAVETVTQDFKQVTPASKFEDLVALLDDFYKTRRAEGRMLVFVNAKDTCKWLDEQLYDMKFGTGALHGNLDQEEREKNLSRFRKGEIDIMVATDVASRGLDIDNVDMVVNYDMPKEKDTYIHRIGRTGRIGNDGRAMTFLSSNDGVCLEGADLLKDIMKVIQTSNGQVPEWLQPLIDSTENPSGGGWGWGDQDARADKEKNTWTASGDAWTSSTWDKKDEGDGGGADKWEEKKSEAWEEKKSEKWEDKKW